MKYPQRRVWLVSFAAVVTFAILETIKALFFSHLASLPSCIITIIVFGTFTIAASRFARIDDAGANAETESPTGMTDEANGLLAAVLTSMREGVIVVNSQMDIVLYNDAAMRVVRLPHNDIDRAAQDHTARSHPSRLPRLVDATRDPAINAAFRRALDEKTMVEARAELASRDTRSYQLNVAPLGMKLAVGVFFDITDLERLERVRREFFANLSHELRTPLTAIIAYSETLLDGAIDDSENNTRFLEKVRKHAVRMSKLISDISDLSTIESASLKLLFEPVRLSDAVADAIALAESRAMTVNVSLTGHAHESLIVQADRTRLEQILHNLVDNAVKFNRQGGAVTVMAEARDGYAVIQVTDTGTGIAAADLPRIFERLYRADKSRSRNIEGTGLGLAIVKHLVQAHDGEITVASELGRGTSFTVTLPLASQSMPPVDTDKVMLSSAEWN